MKPTYTARERMLYRECGCDRVNRRMPPPGVIEAIQERKLTGGFKRRVNGKSNKCSECNQLRAVNGSCGCD